jgi:excisionase family DNA binding protein
MKTDKFYTVKTLADRLAVKPLTIYRMVTDGKLPAVKIGRSIRFDPDKIAIFLDSVRVGPGGLKNGNHEVPK